MSSESALVLAIDRQTKAIESMTKQLMENNDRLTVAIELLVGIAEQQMDGDELESPGSLDGDD